MYLHILGRQPALGLAELEARFGADNVRRFGNDMAIVETNDTPAFGNLGGSIKVGKVLTTLQTTEWPRIINRLSHTMLEHIQILPDGKLKFGLSLYGFDVRPQRINAGGLELKKSIKHTGRSVRVVPNQEAALSSAQTLHNQLTGELGIELLLVKNGTETLVAHAVHVQDIDAYSLRDRGRPKRDARVGMLPPKLAQMIINLAQGSSKTASTSEIPDFIAPKTLLDPFCGTGVVLQEAALMDFRVYGSDLDERMVRYARDNINWLQEQLRAHYAWQLETGDATTHAWRPPIDVVAAETYLGTPLHRLPPPAELDKIVKGCDDLHRKFLVNIGSQLASGTRLCLAVPAWRVGGSFRRLPVIDGLARLGYNRIDFKHVRPQELIYHREDQLVARELLVLTRK